MPSESMRHRPVLLNEVLEYLDPHRGDRYLDVTVGYGGHAAEILKRISPADAVLVDRDAQAQAAIQERFEDYPNLRLIHSDYFSASQQLVQEGQKFKIILADIGVSSPHLDNPERGFSLAQTARLDMRMDGRQELDAFGVVNSYSKAELERILRQYGEEPKARQIAEKIVNSRPIKSTTQLAELVKKVWPGYSKVHPATRTFQAIRIEVNDELGQLRRSLPLWLELLEQGGKLAVITFHSLEDRIVKRFFKEVSGDRYDAEGDLLHPKPITATAHELVNNPRARSAKLRILQRKRK